MFEQLDPPTEKTTNCLEDLMPNTGSTEKPRSATVNAPSHQPGCTLAKNSHSSSS
jgi:hypothetical protein